MNSEQVQGSKFNVQSQEDPPSAPTLNFEPGTLNSSVLTAHLKREAFRLGFTLNGICPAVAPTGVSRLADWLDRGYAGQMSYIASRQDAYSHPRHVLDGCRSIFMLGLPYAAGSQPPAPSPQPLPPAHGLISRYACSDRDYHDTIHDKLKQLIASLHAI